MSAAPSTPSLADARTPDARSSGFGTTLLDLSADGVAAPPRRDGFDVCHPGVVLRALVAGLAALGVAALFASDGVAAWVARVSLGAALLVPGVLVWLLVTCALKRSLARAAAPLQWGFAVVLGALAGAGPALLLRALDLDLGAQPLLGPLLAGAGFAAVLHAWLRLRQQATLPAETAARLSELQSRIRPHFLFNTLNSALALVRVDPARAEDVLEDLAELFRVALTDSGASVSLADEVELARRYLAIEQVRFGERLAVHWELDPAAGAARVPPLILQPLVENAVRHGIEPAPEGGTLRIRTGVRGGRALVSIANSVTDRPSLPGNGMALHNVRERLRLMHDMAAQFDARREDDAFRVQLAVPL